MLPRHASSLRSARAATIAAITSLSLLAPPAEAGNGEAAAKSNDFYLRAGVGLDWSRKTRFMDRDCTVPLPGHFYGCGPGVDGAPYSSPGDFGTMVGFELGVGANVSPALRVEATAEYRPHFSFEGHHNYNLRTPRTVSADASSLSAMLGAYLDLPELGAPRLGPFSPFVGGGIGFTRIDIDSTRLDFPLTFVTIPGGRRTNFSWMVTAGLATALNERLTLDLAWRYTDSGTVETEPGTAATVWRDARSEPNMYGVGRTRADLSSHGLRLSLRYAF